MKWILASLILIQLIAVGELARAGVSTELSSTYDRARATNAVEVIRYEWLDSKRNRKVPVKVYYPQSAGKAPVIVFSHGLGGSREGYEYLGRYYASHGYVSVHLQHLGSDNAVWENAPLDEVMANMRKAAAKIENAVNRPLDASFAIDQLEKLNREESPLKGRLDLDRIGMAGHSFGAYTTLAIAGEKMTAAGRGESSLRDPRIKAAIPMSAPVPLKQTRIESAFADIRIPCLHMTGTLDTSPIGETRAEDRRLPFDHSNGSDQYLLTFKDGDHMIFSGRGRGRGGAQDALFQRYICVGSTAFWDAYLKGDAGAKTWLAQDGFKSALGEHGRFEVKLRK